MSPNRGLQVQEARDLIMLRNEQLGEQGGGLNLATSSTPGTLTTRKRAPPTCSTCHIQGHIDLALTRPAGPRSGTSTRTSEGQGPTLPTLTLTLTL
jgi:hypothetical protein